MDSCTIQLTSGAISNKKLNIRSCGIEFFPDGIFGGSTKDNLGQQITIRADGISAPIKTDIPTDFCKVWPAFPLFAQQKTPFFGSKRAF